MPVIPLSDASRRPTRIPVATASLIAVNAVVFILELQGGDPFVLRWSVVPADIAAGHHWITIFSSMFLRAGWSHFLGNMVFLWAFGPEIEDLMDPRRYLVFYLLGGVAASLTQVAASPASTIPSLGASGAIAVVMGAFLVTYPREPGRGVAGVGDGRRGLLGPRRRLHLRGRDGTPVRGRQSHGVGHPLGHQRDEHCPGHHLLALR